MSEKELIKRLVETKLWGERSVKIGIRANFRCEYCGKDLLKSIANYKEWQEDHIVPLSKGGKDTLDNIALSCRFCNVVLKKRWSPLEKNAKKMSREELIQEVKKHLDQEKKKEIQKLKMINKIINDES